MSAVVVHHGGGADLQAGFALPHQAMFSSQLNVVARLQRGREIAQFQQFHAGIILHDDGSHFGPAGGANCRFQADIANHAPRGTHRLGQLLQIGHRQGGRPGGGARPCGQPDQNQQRPQALTCHAPPPPLRPAGCRMRSMRHDSGIITHKISPGQRRNDTLTSSGPAGVGRRDHVILRRAGRRARWG